MLQLYRRLSERSHIPGVDLSLTRKLCVSFPIAYIHPQTAQKLGIAEGDLIFIETKRGKVKQKVCFSPEIDHRIVMVEYGWWFPEDGSAVLYGWSKSNINILTDDQPPYNREMGSTNLRGILCKIYKAST